MVAISSKSLPSQLNNVKGSVSEPFSFMGNKRDKKGTKIWVNYRPPTLTKGKKWFVSYYYWNEKWVRFKVYEDINRIKDLYLRERYAQDLCTAISEALEEGFNPFYRPEKKTVKVWTVNQAILYYKQKLPERNLRKRTLDTYYSAIKTIEEYFSSNDPIEELTKQRAENGLQEAKRELKWSGATYNNILTICRAIWNWLIEKEITKDNPFRKVKPLSVTVKRHKAFNSETWEKIKANAEPKLLEFILFMYHTGTRPNEARQIKYSDIDHERKLLRVPGSVSKNKKDDYVPLSDYVLQKYNSGEGFIFGTSVNHFTKKFLELKNKLSLDKDHTLYAVKHTCAVDMIKNNVPPYSIMKFFRHSGLEITMKYIRDLGMDVSRDAVDWMAEPK